jgi:hypothetical protein
LKLISNDIKIYERNFLQLDIEFNENYKSKGDNKFTLELKWPKKNYIVIGRTKFKLSGINQKNFSEKVLFLPIQSGFTNYPKLVLSKRIKEDEEFKIVLNK